MTYLAWAIFLFLTQAVSANSGALFRIIETGTPENINITLCLNGYGPLSCQRYNISKLNLEIFTTIPNHTYSRIGIKINTQGYAPINCTAYHNGYCIFSASSTAPAFITNVMTTYQLVTIGNPGNQPNPIDNSGSVDYSYQIGKFTVTIAQYAAFLNAVAKTDTHGLYNENMGTDLNSAGITRSGFSGNYVYEVMDNAGSSANRPITFVNWFDAARFSNWMANGQPSGAQNSITTENGAYALNGAISGLVSSKNTINPNTGAPPSFYIPLSNEWYKAAYYDSRLNNGSGGYYIYATQSNSEPGNVIGDTPNNANFFTGVFSVTGSSNYVFSLQNYITDVGLFSASNSFYGTFDQNGNVWEWADFDGTTSVQRDLLGGHWFSGVSTFTGGLRAVDTATSAYSDRGFRLASPTT
ncbi:MAG: formylglycine-generating enzyme family protein [Gammaproteobacteria bacterium]|nr:formylglycine-generating enzyme family protein [Gammaproteobacteria bacterium]